MDPLIIIASTIAVLQAISPKYKSIQNLRGLPDEFDEVSRILPLVRDTLSLARDQLKGLVLDEASKKTLLLLFKDCEQKAKMLLDTFEKFEKAAENARDGSVLDFYRISLLRLGKAHRVETLMQGILRDLNALAANQWLKTATQKQMVQLKEAIEKLSNVKSSVPDSDFDSSRTHNSQDVASRGIDHRSVNNSQGQIISSGSGKRFGANAINLDQSQRNYSIRVDILRALYTSPYLESKNRIRDRVPGTCEWFLYHHNYQQWRETKSSTLLWLSGNPGCGKSVLAKYLVDSQLKTAESRTTCYFFFKDDFQYQRSAESALSCILHQLFTQRKDFFSDEIVKRLEVYRANLTIPFHELWTALVMVSQDKKAGELVCVIDALDSCEDQGQVHLAEALHNFYGPENTKNNNTNLKFLITSRPHVRAKRRFHPLGIPGLRLIPIRGENGEEKTKIDGEINLYIRHRVSRIQANLRLNQEHVQLLLQKLRCVPHKTFLWAYLTTELIERDINISGLEVVKTFSSLPQNIDEAYERVLAQSSNPKKAKIMLQIIIAALRPLTLEEMDTALTLYQRYKTEDDRPKEHIKDLCGSFITISDSKIHLLHQTARDFLISRDNLDPPGNQGNHRTWKSSLQLPESHRILSQICVRHIESFKFDSHLHEYLEGKLDKRKISHYLVDHVFLDYSATNWAAHFRESGIEDDNEIIKSLRVICDTRSNCCQRWFRIYWASTHTDFPQDFTTLMIASYFGLEQIVKLSLGKADVDVNARDSTYRRSSLSWASENGFQGVVKLLIKGPKLRLKDIPTMGFLNRTEVNSRDRYGRTPLLYAARNGHRAIVQRLLKSGANASLEDENGGTPISYALLSGDEDMVKQLMKGAGFESGDEIRRELLLSAAKNGHKFVVKKLLDTGSDVDTFDSTGRTPLSYAAERGHGAVVQLLLENEAVTDVADDTGQTPWSYAAANEHFHLLEMLRETYKAWGSTEDLHRPQRGSVDNVDSSIPGALADDMEPEKYDFGDQDVDTNKGDKGENSMERDWDKRPDRLDAVELEAKIAELDDNSEDAGKTAESRQPSIFDLDIQSRGTMPSTEPTPHSRSKELATHQVLTIQEAGELEISDEGEGGYGNPEGLYGSDSLAEGERKGQQPDTDDCDAETSYSIDTLSDDPKLGYLQVFAEQLAEDLNQVSNEFRFGNMGAKYLDSVLREFAWKLHGESSDPFQWGASVTIHRERESIIKHLIPPPPDHGVIGSQDSEGRLNEDEERDESPSRATFKKPRTTVMQWVDDIETWSHANEELDPSIESNTVQGDIGILPQLSDYEDFIRSSDAYQWLLTKIRQHGLLAFKEPNAMLEIGTTIRKQLRAQKSLREMSRRKPPSVAKMTFYVNWNPVRSMRDAGFDPPYNEVLERFVCLTGSWSEAQATTVRDYMDQTWPRSGHALITLLQTLLSIPEGQECSYQADESKSSKYKSQAPRLTACVQSPSSCSISVTGGPYFISEISEQIGWLASALRSSSEHHGPAAYTPSVNDLQVTVQEEGPHAPIVVGSCNLFSKFETTETSELSPGFCWGRLFCDPVLVRGYPILRRTQPNTGLEMSLANMAAIVGSQQVVKWSERIIIKGFNMLMIATLAAADMVVWHLLVSGQPGERISYVDARLDTLNRTGISLRTLEKSRHVIGWCSKVTDLCGDASANLDIKSSGLREPPASIVIDRLYIEAGKDFVAGLNMSFNKKEKPFWLVRENDYPSLLKWVGIQPIVFYDVTDRRAWLTDGVSALLHLVRVSLYLDEHNPESAYDWVFDSTAFKDKWEGLTGRQAALKTLKSWDNLNLNLYVTGKQRRSDGGVETQYATLETRVKKILHSIEILIDKQVVSGSQDGIRFAQMLDIGRDIIGFDIQDIINPPRAICSRIKHIGSWVHGWVDLIPSIGTTTIFGQGFGDLMSPEEPHALCSEWKSVPKGKDYMAASVATLQMLYERRLLRDEPNLCPGEMTSKIVWASPNHPFKSCECLNRSASHARNGDLHINTVQFLMAKGSWRSRLGLRGSKPVDVMKLDEKGAVVFGHIPFLNRNGESRSVIEPQEEDLDAESSVEVSSQGMLQPPCPSDSLAANESHRSAGSTGITLPSLEASQSVQIQEDGNLGGDNNQKREKKAERWSFFKGFFRRHKEGKRWRFFKKLFGR